MHAGVKHCCGQGKVPCNKLGIMVLLDQLGQEGPQPASCRVLDGHNATQLKAHMQQKNRMSMNDICLIHLGLVHRLKIGFPKRVYGVSQGLRLRRSLLPEMLCQGSFTGSGARAAHQSKMDCRWFCETKGSSRTFICYEPNEIKSRSLTYLYIYSESILSYAISCRYA